MYKDDIITHVSTTNEHFVDTDFSTHNEALLKTTAGTRRALKASIRVHEIRYINFIYIEKVTFHTED